MAGKRSLKRAALPLAIAAMLLGGVGCRDGSRTAAKLADDAAAAQEIESNLTFNNITLEQADEQGKTLWKVKATQAVYDQEDESARVQAPNGDLFQDGKPRFRVRGQTGFLKENGESIQLKGRVVATDLESGAVLRGEELEWTPEEGLLVVRDGLTVTHPQLRVSATEAQVFHKARRMELLGQVVATSVNPVLRLKGDRFSWDMNAKIINSDRPAQVERLINNRVTDTARGDRVQFNLNTNQAVLRQNALLSPADPPVQIRSDQLEWNLTGQTMTSPSPVSILHPQQQVLLTSDRGRMDLTQRILYMEQNVRVTASRNNANLESDRLTWTLPTQQFVAEGNVRYRQTNPPSDIRGTRANGSLQTQQVVVSGGVVTEIIPPRP